MSHPVDADQLENLDADEAPLQAEAGEVPITTRSAHGLRRLSFFARVSLVLAVVLAAKTLVHRLQWEVLAPNPLFPALVASEVFLLGFLLNGVLLDYKESEKIPAELAASLECLASEVANLGRLHPDAEVHQAEALLVGFSESLLVWMTERAPLETVLGRFDDLQLAIERLSTWSVGPLQARLLAELATLRRSLHRIEVIRETTFVPTVYAMAYFGTALVTGGLLFSEIEPFGESLFFIGAISFLLIKLLLLIADLDNPFSADELLSVENICLLPLQRVVRRLRMRAEQS